MYDIVIPVGPNDVDVFGKQIEYTKRNCIGHRKIYVIAASSVESLVKTIPECTFIDESIFPFDLRTLHTYSGSHASERNGWYFQQLLKLYAGILPGILDRWLVVDTDTFFLKPVTFIEEVCLYATGCEYWPPYFAHMDRLLPGLSRVIPMSGICHHMIFEKRFVAELMEKVEQIHQKPFWSVFMSKVDPAEYYMSGASEYELYFNYMLTYHPECICIRPLRWDNVSTLNLDSDYDYISYHHYMRS